MGRHVWVYWLPLVVAALTACGNSSDRGSSNNGQEGGTSGNASSSGTSSGGSSSGGTGGTGTGGSGTNSSGVGSSGTSSTGSSGTGSSGSIASSGMLTGGGQSVLQRGGDLLRRATFTEPGLVKSMVATMAPNTTFNTNATFPANGSTQNQGTASVLYLETGPAAGGCPAGATGCTATARPANNGLFFAFPAGGSNPNVVAFDETSGLPVWTAHLAAGGDGIRGTPVIDATSRRLFIVTGNNPHVVHAVAVDTGAEITTGGWPVSLSAQTVSYSGTTFNSGGQNQHGASLLLRNILYIPFGGQYGDGGNYNGWIVAVDTTNPSKIGAWATQSARSGIWGSGGLVSDGQTSVFGVTGDTTSVPRAMSDSEEVVRVTGMAAFTRSAANVFVPTEWQGWDKPTADLDFGASTPAYIPLPAGSTPAALLVAPAKAGRLFILDGTNLSSGMYDPTARTAGGALANIVVSGTGGETVYTAPTVYTSASGLHATINVGGGGAGCPAGTPNSQEMIVSALIQPGQTPIAKVAWCAPASGGGHYNVPPISTTTDGVGADALVWFVNGTQLTAVDGDTGAKVVTTAGAACNRVPSMSFPIAVKNRVVVSALGHLCSWSLGGI
jgi:hypothetical protein